MTRHLGCQSATLMPCLTQKRFKHFVVFQVLFKIVVSFWQWIGINFDLLWSKFYSIPYSKVFSIPSPINCKKQFCSRHLHFYNKVKIFKSTPILIILSKFCLRRLKIFSHLLNKNIQISKLQISFKYQLFNSLANYQAAVFLS